MDSAILLLTRLRIAVLQLWLKRKLDFDVSEVRSQSPCDQVAVRECGQS